MATEEATYWARRAAEERRLAASLPESPAARIHRQLAELYELAVTGERTSPVLPNRGGENRGFRARASHM